MHLPAATAVATQWGKNFSKLLKSHRLVSSLIWKHGNVASGSVVPAGAILGWQRHKQMVRPLFAFLNNRDFTNYLVKPAAFLIGILTEFLEAF